MAGIEPPPLPEWGIEVRPQCRRCLRTNRQDSGQGCCFFAVRIADPLLLVRTPFEIQASRRIAQDERLSIWSLTMALNCRAAVPLDAGLSFDLIGVYNDFQVAGSEVPESLIQKKCHARRSCSPVSDGQFAHRSSEDALANATARSSRWSESRLLLVRCICRARMLHVQHCR